MAKRKSRKSICYRPKGKAKARTRGNYRHAADELNVPSDKLWNSMYLFGAFSMGDKADSNLKYRFRRGDIATILPSHKVPGEPIEPHEYWVGKILEIRADQGSVDSQQIWTKVQWLYSAQEAQDLIPSLNTSQFGKFERIWSDHWDFVYPHAFNEVITLPRLLTFPRLSPPSAMPFRTPKQQRRRGQLNLSRETSLLSSLSTLTTTTANTTTTGGGGGSSASGSTNATTVAPGGNESTFAVIPTLQDLTAQKVIGPGVFYWRYTLSVQERIIDPQPVSPSNCICSKPYLPDETSVRNGVMVYCPRLGCRTGYHLGCLEDVSCFWVDGGGEDLGEGDVGGDGRKVAKGKGKGKKKTKPNQNVTDEDNEQEEEKWLSKRAIRQLSTSPNSDDTYINILSLLTSQQPPEHKTASTLTSTSTKAKAKMKKQVKQRQSDGDAPIISLLKRVYDRQLEQYYLYSQSETESQPPSRHLKKPPTQNLTTNSLLATLFILPPPFPPSSSSLSSSQSSSQSSSSSSSSPLTTLFTPPPTPPPSLPNSLSSSKSKSKSKSKQNERQKQRRRQCRLHVLLAVACQPLIRGGGACFEGLGLGPTGNVNVVLGAREFVWEVVRRVGELDLDLGLGLGLEGGRGWEKRVRVVDEDESRREEEGEREGEELPEQERRDKENFARIRDCVEMVLEEYRETFFGQPSPPTTTATASTTTTTTKTTMAIGNENTGDRSNGIDGGPSNGTIKESVLPPEGSIEDAIVVKKGLLFFDYLHRSGKRTSRTRVGSSSDSTSTSASTSTSTSASTSTSTSASTSTSTSTEDEDEDEGEDGDGDVDVRVDGDEDVDVDIEGGATDDDPDDGGIGMGYLKMKEEPVSDVEFVSGTEQEEEEDDDDNTSTTSADEIDHILLPSPRKRKRSTITAAMATKRNSQQTRKKLKMGGAKFGRGGSDDNADDDGGEEEEEDADADAEESSDEEEDEDEGESSGDNMLLSADWACPGCGGSI